MTSSLKALPLFFACLLLTGHGSVSVAPANNTDGVPPPATFLSPKAAVGASADASPLGSLDMTTASMEAAMTDLMLGKGEFGATPMGGSVKQIQNLIDNVMRPKIMAAHKSDVKDLGKSYSVLQGCLGSLKRSKAAAGNQAKTYRSSSVQHKRCRADEAVKFTTKKNCLTQQKSLFLIKKGKCDTFKTLVGKIGTTKDNRAIVTKAGGESIESYITRISTTICGKHTHGKYGNKKDTGGWGGGLRNGFLDQYWKAKDACDRAEKKWKNKVKECKVKVADYKRRKGQCDQFQTTMDAASCKGAIQSQDACQAYAECYNSAKNSYNKLVHKVKTEIIDRKAEWRGVHRISCLIKAFADGKVTGAEVDACKRKSVSTKPMDIKIKPVPPQAKCTVSQLYPSTGAYKRKEFAPLPMLAKGKESVECNGMTEISLKPKKGSPGSCKCSRVSLNGPYSAKAMVKCTNCIDVRRNTDTDSCPKGTKIFSPASRDDWKTFFASASRLAAPHWIVDVTKPTSGARKSGSPMNSGNRKQRAAGWTTSDGSPWWLRSRGYGEPNGDYHANCYMGLGGRSADAITFNDARCGYHSKSYYCQLKRLDLKPSGNSPRSCKCYNVDLTGSYKPGTLVKCSECLDVSKSTQRNSCPKGMKIFSPTSASDWSTFIKSAGPLNAPHFIIDVTRPYDRCQRGSRGCEKSAMNSKNPKQSTWRTADRSPWWLRSQPYGQPDGNYKANCYLHLWNTPHNSPSNIQFDDANRGAGCYYHSRSYYCQPKMKTASQMKRALELKLKKNENKQKLLNKQIKKDKKKKKQKKQISPNLYSVRSGAKIHIANLYNGHFPAPTYLDTCGMSGCAGGYEVSTTNKGKDRAGQGTGTWIIEKKRGKGFLHHGDVITIKNMYKTPTMLDVCGRSNCGGGWEVSTSTNFKGRGNTNQWQILKVRGSGVIKYGDLIHIKSLYTGGKYKSGTYLDVCGSSNCGGGWEVSTTASKDRARGQKTGTWRIDRSAAEKRKFNPNKACKRPRGWCGHKGARYSIIDCDGDGIGDPYCSDGRHTGFLPSASKCRSTWPRGTCKNKALCSKWFTHPGKYSGGYAPGQSRWRGSVSAAKARCLKTKGCRAVTCGKQYGGKCTLRSTHRNGLKPTPKRNAETTYTPQDNCLA